MASQLTRDHELIRRWAAERGARPTIVSRGSGMLRFEFEPESAPELAEADWVDFFQVFDEKGLQLVYDDQSGSRFHKIVYAESVVPETVPAPRARSRAALALVAGAGAARARKTARSHPAPRRASAAGRQHRRTAATSPKHAGRSAARPAAAKAGRRAKPARAPSATRAKASTRPRRKPKAA